MNYTASINQAMREARIEDRLFVEIDWFFCIRLNQYSYYLCE